MVMYIHTNDHAERGVAMTQTRHREGANSEEQLQYAPSEQSGDNFPDARKLRLLKTVEVHCMLISFIFKTVLYWFETSKQAVVLTCSLISCMN